MEKGKKYFALIDIGGTYTKVKVLALEKEKYKEKFKKKSKIKNKKELLEFLKIYLKNFTQIELGVFSIAGPVFNKNKGFMTNWEGSPSINLIEFKKQLNLKNFFLLNDMEAQGYGLISLNEENSLYKICKKIYSPKKILKNLNMVLVVPGTGLGSCAILEQNKIIPLELQHSTFYPLDQRIKKLQDNFFKEGIFPSFESFVSGEGIFNTFFKLKKIKKEDINLKIRKGAEFVYSLAKNRDREAIEVFDIYFKVLAIYCQVCCLSFKPFAGVFIGGKPAIKNQLFFKRKIFLNAFFQNQKHRKLLKKFPIFFIDKELIFEGLLYFLKKMI